VVQLPDRGGLTEFVCGGLRFGIATGHAAGQGALELAHLRGDRFGLLRTQVGLLLRGNKRGGRFFIIAGAQCGLRLLQVHIRSRSRRRRL
jgi:hypothetical protein